MLPIDAEQGLKDIVNGFYDPLQKITDSMGVFKGYASAGQRRESICAAPVHDITDFKQSIDGLIHVKDNLNEWLKHWNDNKSKIRLNATGWNELCNATGLAGANNQCTDEKSAKTYFTNLFLQSNSDSTKMVSKLIGTSIHLEQILAEKNDVMPTVIDALDRLQKDKILSGEAFQKFSKYIRFFGMLADATTGEEVKGILESFTLPAVSFYLKRESGHHLMLSSYFGFAQNMNKKNEIDESNSGFFVPVGLEYTFDKKTFGMNYDGALSIMVSPFDFGYPVNLKLNGTSENIEFDEIVAPSITIAYGFKEYPIVVGFGVQKGAKLDGMDTEERVLLFVAFDMPLFSLFDL